MIWTTDAGRAPSPGRSRPGRGSRASRNAESLGWGRLVCLHPDDRESDRARHGRLARRNGARSHWRTACGVPTESGATWRSPSSPSSRRTAASANGSARIRTSRNAREAELALAAAKEAAESGQPGQERVPGQHEPRAADAAIGGDRLQRDAGGGGRGAGQTVDAHRPRQDQVERQAPARADQRRARPEQGRSQQDGPLRRGHRRRDFVRDAAGTVDALVDASRTASCSTSARRSARCTPTPSKLRQCLFNLLSNAAKFTENGTITLAARREASGRATGSSSQCVTPASA